MYSSSDELVQSNGLTTAAFAIQQNENKYNHDTSSYYSTIPQVQQDFTTQAALSNVVTRQTNNIVNNEFDVEYIEEDVVLPNMQQEIECPRCSDIMTLSSDFDRLLYFCGECQLSLIMK